MHLLHPGSKLNLMCLFTPLVSRYGFIRIKRAPGTPKILELISPKTKNWIFISKRGRGWISPSSPFPLLLLPARSPTLKYQIPRNTYQKGDTLTLLRPSIFMCVAYIYSFLQVFAGRRKQRHCKSRNGSAASPCDKMAL